MESERSEEENRDVEEAEEENVLAVHYPRESKKLKIKFRDSSPSPSSPGQSVDVRRGQRENSETVDDDNEEEEEAEEAAEIEDKKLSSQDNDLDIRRGVYKCCVYLCASVICFTIMIGIVAIGYVFHLSP